MLLWIAYAATSFRSPLSPIVLSDLNSGATARQLIFGGAGMSAFGLLFLTRSLGALITLNVPITLLAAFIALSVLWSDLPSLTLKRSILFTLCLITVYTLVYGSTRPTTRMLKIIVNSTATIALLSLLIYLVFPKTYSVNPARAGLAGIAVHPNTLAPFLSIGLLLSLGVQTHTARQVIRLRASQALLSIALLLTFSMTTWLTTLLGGALYLFFASSQYRKGALQLIVLSAITLVSLIGVANIKSEVFEITGRDESLSGRDELWSIVINEGQENPTFGKGFGAFWTEGKGRELVQTWNPRQSHNAYLDVWLDLGLLGFMGILFCFPFALLRRWHQIKDEANTQQRRTTAALYSTAISYMIIYAFAQSFFLRFDSFPFLIIAWITLLVANKGSNGIESEFDQPQQ